MSKGRAVSVTFSEMAIYVVGPSGVDGGRYSSSRPSPTPDNSQTLAHTYFVRLLPIKVRLEGR